MAKDKPRLRIQRGSLVAAALAGAWRRITPDLKISADDLAKITPLLLMSGGAALVWRRVSTHGLGTSPAALQLRQAYRLHAIRAAVHEPEIALIITTLRSADLETLVGKGWAIARLYPKTGLRPYGDVDLYIRPEQYAAAAAALWRPDAPACPVDLHRGSAELDDRSFDDLYDRSQLVRLGEVDVRILGPEDHLRLLCLHALRHGAWRPLWLCDIGAALESRPSDFDWNYFLSGNQRRSDWVACTLGLAHQILGAELENTPIARRAKNLPRWLVRTVLRQWGGSYTPQGCRPGMANYVRNPSGVLEALRIRWPNAIEATVGVRGPFNELPRLPFQIGDAVRRTAGFLAQAPRLLRQQHRVRT